MNDDDDDDDDEEEEEEEEDGDDDGGGGDDDGHEDEDEDDDEDNHNDFNDGDGGDCDADVVRMATVMLISKIADKSKKVCYTFENFQWTTTVAFFQKMTFPQSRVDSQQAQWTKIVLPEKAPFNTEKKCSQRKPVLGHSTLGKVCPQHLSLAVGDHKSINESTLCLRHSGILCTHMFIDSSCYKDVAKYDCLVYMYNYIYIVCHVTVGGI